MNHLFCWRPETVAAAVVRGTPIRYTASNQFGNRLRAGDVIWIVTSKDGRLMLVGRVEVETFGDRAMAEQRFGSIELWNAQWYAVARQGTEQVPRLIDITAVAEKLQFHPQGAPRLTLESGQINPQQLQTMRTLSAESATIVERLWRSADWTLQSGQTIRRVALHEQFGGRGQGGIGPSATSANVFLFSDPASGQHDMERRWTVR